MPLDPFSALQGGSGNSFQGSSRAESGTGLIDASGVGAGFTFSGGGIKGWEVALIVAGAVLVAMLVLRR